VIGFFSSGIVIKWPVFCLDLGENLRHEPTQRLLSSQYCDLAWVPSLPELQSQGACRCEPVRALSFDNKDSVADPIPESCIDLEPKYGWVYSIFSPTPSDPGINPIIWIPGPKDLTGDSYPAAVTKIGFGPNPICLGLESAARTGTTPIFLSVPISSLSGIP